MTFNDIFTSNFLSQVTSFSAVDMLIAMALSFALGLFIFYVYKRVFRGVMYSQSFGVSLLALTMITTLVIEAVTSNVVLSLGMVGALSIVRFRTAIKEPMDIAFLFWAIAVGIVVGAGMIPLAVFGSIVIGLILVVFVNRKPSDAPYLLILRLEGDEVEDEALKLTREKSSGRATVKSKTVERDNVELTLEIRLKDGATRFVNELSALPGVKNASLVSYNGEYMS